MKALEILFNINVWGDVNEVQEQIDEVINELEELESRSCDNCKNSSFETKFGELEFNACFLVSNGNVCKWESK